MSTYEFCDACQGEGRCARCGEQLTEADTPYDEYLPCPACGWKDGDEGLPEPWECACWRDEVEELRAEEFNLVFSREFYPDPFGEEDINYGV
jgi:DNA-directed RNA polymerase subunit RPC12/RpoP